MSSKRRRTHEHKGEGGAAFPQFQQLYRPLQEQIRTLVPFAVSRATQTLPAPVLKSCPANRRPNYVRQQDRYVCAATPLFEPLRLMPENVWCCPPTELTPGLESTERDILAL